MSRDASVESGPSSNHAAAAVPFGLIVPLRVPLTESTPVAGFVVTVGGVEVLPPDVTIARNTKLYVLPLHAEALYTLDRVPVVTLSIRTATESVRLAVETTMCTSVAVVTLTPAPSIWI